MSVNNFYIHFSKNVNFLTKHKLFCIFVRFFYIFIWKIAQGQQTLILYSTDFCGGDISTDNFINRPLYLPRAYIHLLE